jgi:hypothetical protein
MSVGNSFQETILVEIAATALVQEFKGDAYPRKAS